MTLDTIMWNRPTEIEAYRYAVQEARRLGLSDERISCYLRTEWMSDDDLAKLAKSVGVHFDSASGVNFEHFLSTDIPRKVFDNKPASILTHFLS